MSTGSWEPNSDDTNNEYCIDNKLLKRFVTISENEQLSTLSNQLTNTEIQQHSQLMQQSKSTWIQAGDHFNDQDLEHLIRFFTIAEQLPGWQAGENSPVIWLGKILKQRKAGLSKDLIIWIKANSNNQFLPHGPLL